MIARVRTPAVYRSRLIEPLLSKLRECWVSQDSRLSSRSKLSAVTVAPPSRKTSGIPHRVGQLVFDEVGAKAQHFIQNGSRHGPKAMTCHFLFADPHAPQSRQNRIVADRPISPRSSGTREVDGTPAWSSRCVSVAVARWWPRTIGNLPSNETGNSGSIEGHGAKGMAIPQNSPSGSFP